MCRPPCPSPDAYDENWRVAPHFSTTPPLTPLPVANHYYIVDAEIAHEVREIYRKYALSMCDHRGLYWVGSQAQNDNLDNDHIMLLVVELTRQEIGEWWKMDGDIRELLESYELSGVHGVCVRYYAAPERRTERLERLRSAQATDRVGLSAVRREQIREANRAFHERRTGRRYYGPGSPVARSPSTVVRSPIPSYRPHGVSYVDESSSFQSIRPQYQPRNLWQDYRPLSPDLEPFDRIGALRDDSVYRPEPQDSYMAAWTFPGMASNREDYLGLGLSGSQGNQGEPDELRDLEPLMPAAWLDWDRARQAES